MVAVRMVRVRNMPADEMAGILVHCPMCVRDWLRRYDEGDLEGYAQWGVSPPRLVGGRDYHVFNAAQYTIFKDKFFTYCI